MKNFLLKIFLASFPLTSLSYATVNRPPQFVVFAFDGSQQINRWQETRAFAKKLAAQGTSLKFTYFISGVYFLGPKTCSLYQGPHHEVCESDIGFAESSAEIIKRISEVEGARQEGHEIGSHANGHFSSLKWSTSDWEKELEIFKKLTFGVFENNKIQEGSWQMAESDIVGFRAPLLEGGPNLPAALIRHGYRYDTSLTAGADYWPEKKNGLWNFPLAELQIAGTGKWTLSMDYNFFMAQSHEKEDLAHAALYEQQMVDTYVRYFTANYNGNRAPVHIGHHFTEWNGGAYWKAMMRFAESVCAQPEVKCVTYKELANFMDKASPEVIKAYKTTQFEKGKVISISTKTQAPLDVKLKVVSTDAGTLKAVLMGADATSKMKIHWENEGQTIALGNTVDPVDGAISVVATLNGQEILRATHEIEKDENNLNLSDDLERQSLLGDMAHAH